MSKRKPYSSNVLASVGSSLTTNQGSSGWSSRQARARWTGPTAVPKIDTHGRSDSLQEVDRVNLLALWEEFRSLRGRFGLFGVATPCRAAHEIGKFLPMKRANLQFSFAPQPMVVTP